MQKAIKWLDEKNIKYHFHNYKESGIDAATIENWLLHFPTDKLINTKGTTYRALTAEEKESIINFVDAIRLMIVNPSLIKRPVWDFGNGTFFLGWDEAAIGNMV